MSVGWEFLRENKSWPSRVIHFLHRRSANMHANSRNLFQTEQPPSVKRLTAGINRLKRVIFLDEPNHVLAVDDDDVVRV